MERMTPLLETDVDETNQVSKETDYDLLIVIVNWNVKDLLARCLESVSTPVSGLSVCIVVVDNDSSDGSAEMLRHRFPHVKLIRNQKNVGFARANNLVLRCCQKAAKYYLLLNPDTVVSRDCLQRMIGFLEAHPEAGVVGCKLVKPDGTLDWACKRSFIYPSVLFYRALGLDRRFPNSPRFGRYQLSFLDPDQVHEVDSVAGAFLMIRQACMLDIGLLDESFFMYGEDLDWCYRARKAGWKVFYVPTANVVHHKGQSTRIRSHRMIYHWYSAIWTVYRKHLSQQYPATINALVWTGCHVMCALSLFRNVLRREKRVPSRL